MSAYPVAWIVVLAGASGDAAASSVEIRRKLFSPDRLVRLEAVDALAKLAGDSPDEAGRFLAGLFGDPDGKVRRTAVRTFSTIRAKLTDMGVLAAANCAALRSPDDEVAIESDQWFDGEPGYWMLEGPFSFEFGRLLHKSLVEMLKEDLPARARGRVGARLLMYEPIPREAVYAFATIAPDHPNVRSFLWSFRDRAAPDSGRIEPALRRFAESADLRLAMPAIGALGRQSVPQEAKFARALVAGLRNKDEEIAGEAGQSLLAYVRDPECVVEELLELFAQPSHPQLTWIIATLGRTRGEKRRLVLAAFRSALETRPVHFTLLEVAGEMGPDAVLLLPVLVRCFDNPDRQVADAAVRTVGRIGKPAASVVPALIARMERVSKDSAQRGSLFCVLNSIIRIEPAHRRAIAKIIEALERNDSESHHAVWMLCECDVSVPEVRDQLLAVTAGSMSLVLRLQTVEALDRKGIRTDSTRQTLIDCITGNCLPDFRIRAIELAVKAGIDRPLELALRRAAEDPNVEVARAAKALLARLSGS